MPTSAITIEELTGEKRRFVLKGAGLPLKGASWAAATRVSTTWNNGNPEATQHVLTSEELPSDWQGVWRTPQLLVTPCSFADRNGVSLVGLAFEMKQAMDSIRERGQLLRVTWANEIQRRVFDNQEQRTDSHKEVRLGRLVEFSAEYSTLDDIQWSATFDWVSRGQTTPKSVEFRGEELIAATREAIQKQTALTKQVALSRIRALESQGFRRKNFADTFTLGQLESMAEAPLAIVDSFADAADALTNRMQQLGDVILKARDVPASIASRALATATGAVAAVNDFVDALSRQGPEQAVLTSAYYSGVQTQAQLVAEANQRFAEQARRRQSLIGNSAEPLANSPRVGDVLQTHIPRSGETFDSIARRFYDAELGAELASANGYPSYAVVPSARVALIIPTRSALESSAVRSI